MRNRAFFFFCTGHAVSFSGLGVRKRDVSPKSANRNRSNRNFGVFNAPIATSQNGSKPSEHAKSHGHGTDAFEEVQQRRRFVTETAKIMSTAFFASQYQATTANAISATAAGSKIFYPRIESTKVLTQYIRNHCNHYFVSSVIDSGCNFIYRGLSPKQSNAMLQTKNINNGIPVIKVTDEPFDLLDPETYQSKNAAKYFQHLEEEMIARGMNIKPSNGHLATTCPKEASRWGDAASIWPLGERNVEFAWLENGGVFWPIPEGGNEQSVMPSSSIISSVDDGRQGFKLETALKGDAWEIMFRADDGFLAVPVDLDAALKQNLHST